jgi:ABC-type branched-subunit amino acid transport system ATPase component/branched-subunit amino acid ABC-type transport system permease component
MGGDLLLFALLGLGTGAVYAGLGVGLVITHKGSGVVNFAQGAVAMWGAFVYLGLRTTGRLYLPVVGLPASIGLGRALPVWAALLLAVASGAGVSLLAYFLIFYPLRRAPDLSKVVASVGLMMLLEAVATVQFGSQEAVVPSFFPTGSLRLAGQPVPVDLLAISAAVVLITAAVWAYFSFTRLGWATVAVARGERDLALLGWRPARIAAGAWTLSGAVAGLVGVLVAPVIGVNTVDYTLFVVPALAVALAGRLGSLPVTCLAGLALGMAQSVIGYLQTLSWFPSWASSSAGEALPLLLIVLVLALRGRRLAAANVATALVVAVRPRHTVGPAVALGLVGLLGLLLGGGAVRFGVIETLAALPLMLSYVILTGLAGQISLAQVTLAGISALTLTKLGAAASLPFPLPVLVSALAATAVGLVIALPALRIRGIQLAIVTLAFAVAIEEFVFNNPVLVSGTVNPVPPARLPGLNLAVRQGANVAQMGFGVLALVVVVLLVAVTLNLARSRTGLRLLAVRSSETVASSVGVNVTAAKLTAFALASFVAGVSGSLIAYSYGQFSAGSFDVLAAGLPFLAFAYVGGIGSALGAALASALAPAGVVVTLVSGVGTALGQYYLLASGLALIGAAIAYPEGMAGAIHRLYLAQRSRPEPAASPQPPPRPPLPALIPAPEGRERLLRVQNLSVRYGGVVALDGVELEVGRGQVVGLIGPNGAGKTSLIDAITGFTPAGGSARLGGGELLGLPPHKVARRGVLRTWQTPVGFRGLSVWEDLSVAGARSRPLALELIVPERPGAVRAAAEFALSQVGAAELAGLSTEQLSAGQQRLVGIARVLMRQPRLLLLDEPAAGLDAGESARLAVVVRQLAAPGVGLLLVDHDMDFVFASCDYVYVVDFGRLIAEGPPGEVRANPTVMAAYLGASSPSGVGAGGSPGSGRGGAGQS